MKFTNGQELLRHGITRFATNFIMLKSIVPYKKALRGMTNRRGGRNKSREKISRVKSRSQENCPQSEFWSKARDIRKIEDQLIKVLRLVDGDEKPRWVSFMRHCIVSFMRHWTGKS